MDLYRSSANPRIPLTTEAELQAALDAGFLEETHHLELKRQINKGPKDNDELARDLAQFAVDGGALIVGVQENPPQLMPVLLAGLPERIEQIARIRIDPLLTVRFTVIASAQDPTIGYVVVEVPASPLAPHQVGGAYFDRGDKTKFKLSDERVRMLHERRRPASDIADRLLDQMTAADPVEQGPAQGHLFLVAQPVTPRPDRMSSVTENLNSASAVLAFFHRALSRPGVAGAAQNAFGGGIADVSGPRETADGCRLTTWALDEGRDDAPPGTAPAKSVDIRTDGGLRIYSDRLSRAGQDGLPLLDEGDTVVTAHQLVELVEAVAEHSGYRGSWIFGFAGTNLSGASSLFHARSSWGSRPIRIDVSDYRRFCEVTHDALTKQPKSCVNLLVGPLLRAIGSRQAYANFLDD